MMRCYRVLTQAFGQVPRQAFCQAPGIDENQRGTVLLDQGLQPIVEFFPDLVGHHRAERRRGHFQGQLARTLMPGVDDGAFLAAGKKAGNFFDGLLRGRQANATWRMLQQGVEPRQRQGQVATALAAGHRMNLVDDNRANGSQHVSAGGRSQ